MGRTPQPDPTIPPHQTVTKERFYRPELDGLRFFAFLAVFGLHASVQLRVHYIDRHVHQIGYRILQGIGLAGSRGVDLFFALSAYLITELLLREKSERGSLDVRSFYIRRILRIWPLYYLCIVISEVNSLLSPSHPFPLPYFLTFALLVGNWGVIAFQNTFLFAPLWSVSIEEQFYLLWPPIVARLTRRQIVITAVVMIGLANLIRIVIFLAGCSDVAIYFNTVARLDEIAGGILLAVLLRHRVPSLHYGIRLALITAAVLCTILTGYYKALHRELTWIEVMGSYPVTSACCTLIVFCFLGMQFKSQILRYLGKISYSLYVFHFACIKLVDKYFNTHVGLIYDLLRIILALALTILVSAFSYRFLESPFLKLKRRFTYVESRPV